MENIASQVIRGKNELSRSWECGHVYLKCSGNYSDGWNTPQLQGSSRAHNWALENVCSQLEAERNASCTGMDEAMKKISLLHNEKAQLEMEVNQFKRETHQKIASANTQLDYYHNLLLQKDEEIMSINGFFSDSDPAGSCSSSDGSSARMRKPPMFSSQRKKGFSRKNGRRVSNLSCVSSVAESCSVEKNIVCGCSPFEPLLKDICTRIQGLEEDIKLLKTPVGAHLTEVFVEEEGDNKGGKKKKEQSPMIAVMIGLSVGCLISVLVGNLKPRSASSQKM
ncbi:hypothetical protein SUGI_1001190 [Cryptomeria japonica]|nr:hypothetical protein SUGI_1001190 [Cryptomeria japonica]